MAENQHRMQDPAKQYPVMDIPEQTQPEPGLDADLKPQADHGQATYKGADRLIGRKALITGGDSGIGRAVAIAFAREGADVVISHLPSEQIDADETIRLADCPDRKMISIAGDLSDETFCQQLVDRTADELGGIDILVNNAVKQIYVDTLEDLSVAQIKETFTVNVFAMFALTKAALKHLPKGATIINTTSIQAYQPSSGFLDYAATKAAIANFTKGLAEQLAPKGIRVNAVAPGPFWTPLQPSHGQPQEKLAQFGQDTPLGRAGQPAELGPTYVFLASQESSYITGEIIGVTGGRPIS
jgi:NAD(P)-dependent dehydrogenase (short-subunit alcohol dehydrogenase family)